MPFATADYPTYSPPAQVAADTERRFLFRAAGQSVVTELKIGDAVYPLRRPCTSTFIPMPGELLVEGFSPVFIGRGQTVDQAKQDWLLEIHAAFQRLVNMRPFEMVSEDRRRWSVLTAMIDVAVYRNTTPLVVRQFAKVTRWNQYPLEVQWDDGGRYEVDYSLVYARDFATYALGQPFEALVERNPNTFDVLRILHTERRRDPWMPRAAEEALLSVIGSTNRLPESNW